MKRVLFILIALLLVSPVFAGLIDPLPNITNTSLTTGDVKNATLDALKEFFSSQEQEQKAQEALKNYFDNLNILRGSMRFSGTDYVLGETGAVFLQLLDSNGAFVNNGSCAFDMHNATVPFAKIYDNVPLINIPDSHGIYIYTFQVPSKSGVYPVDAQCNFAFNPVYYYAEDSFLSLNYTVKNAQTFGGNVIDVNSFMDGLYFSFKDVNGVTNLTYTWENVTGNYSSLQFIWFGESDKIPLAKFYVLNASTKSFVSIGNITLTGTATAGSTGADDVFTVFLPDLKNIINSSTKKVSVQIFSTVGAHFLYNNFINLKGFDVNGTSVELKGSSEVHVYDNGFSSLNLSLENILNLSREINITTHETLTVVNNINLTVGNILGLAQQINVTTLQNLAFVIEINATTHSNSNKLDTIIAIVTDSNMTIYMNKATLAALNLTANQILNVSNQLEVKLDVLNITVNNIKDDTSNILIILNNLTVGNLSVTANVNVSAIVEAILGADVEETIVSTSGGQFARESLLGGVAFAAPIDSGVQSMCISNQTLVNSVTKLRCVNNVCNTIVSNATINCPFGCNSGVQPNECFPSKSQSNIFFFIVLIIIIVVILALIAYFKSHR